MTPRDIRNIHTTKNFFWTYFHLWHDTKTTQVFSPADGEASSSLLLNLVSFLSQCLSSNLQVRSEKAKKGFNNNFNHSYYHCSFLKSVSTDLTLTFSSNQADRKRWAAWLVDVTNIYFIRYFYCDTITRRVINEC